MGPLSKLMHCARKLQGRGDYKQACWSLEVIATGKEAEGLQGELAAGTAEPGFQATRVERGVEVKAGGGPSRHERAHDI